MKETLKRIGLCAMLVLLVAAISLGKSTRKTPTANSRQVATASTSKEIKVEEKKPITPVLVDNPAPLAMSTKSVLALDLASGKVLYSQNPDEKLPIASLTKLMTAMVVLDHTNKDTVVTVEQQDVQVICSCMGLVSGEQISVENLLKGLLIPSGNDAALALARSVGGTNETFVSWMNEKAKNLNLVNTQFSNPVGLDSSENYSTANDLAKITQEFLKYSILEKIVATAGEDVSSVDGKIVHHLKTSNKLLLEDSDIVGVKTGFTNDAQGNLIVKIDHNGILVLTIVLNTPDREDETQKLIDWIFANYKW